MDKKFMKIKKLIIPVMTVVVLTSQLMGCASVSSKEMLELLQEGESIEIEVAMPSYFEDEQGTEIIYTWQELGHLDTNKDFRLTFDDLTYTHSAGEAGKNGPMYIDLEGNWTNNSTLYFAMMNKTFVEKYWNSTDVRDSLRESIQANYVDVDEQSSDSIKDASIINAYFNLINDNEPGYMNPNSTLTRGEFLQAIVKADTPVDKTLKADESLVDLVGQETETEVLATQALADSYLDTESKSLDAQTFTGTISKAEAVYTVVHRYFSNELEAVTGKEGAYADTKNAGNIAQRAKLIDKDSESKPDRWKAATLSLMLQNPEKGIDEDFYKAYVVAKKVGLLPSGVTESNWDEAITKAETIDLLLNTYKAIATRDGYATDAQDGLNEGTVIDRGDTTTVNSGSGSAGVSIIVDGEIVEGTALTQAEIDELKANATTDKAKRNVEIYEAIVNNGGYDFGDGGDPITKAVGTPGDTSWRRMTDEEAQRIFETADPNSSEYSSAKAELQGAEWSKIWGTTVYFDYYEYKKVIQTHLEEVRNSEEYRIVHEEVQSPEEGSDEWRAALGWD